MLRKIAAICCCCGACGAEVFCDRAATVPSKLQRRVREVLSRRNKKLVEPQRNLTLCLPLHNMERENLSPRVCVVGTQHCCVRFDFKEPDTTVSCPYECPLLLRCARGSIARKQAQMWTFWTAFWHICIITKDRNLTVTKLRNILT